MRRSFQKSDPAIATATTSQPIVVVCGNNNGGQQPSTIEDELNLGTLLSRMDGIGNYSGLVIVGCTNNKDDLPPALLRDQRLTPLAFDYCRSEDIAAIMTRFFELEKLDEDQKLLIPDRCDRITPAKVRACIEHYENNLSGFLEWCKGEKTCV